MNSNLRRCGQTTMAEAPQSTQVRTNQLVRRRSLLMDIIPTVTKNLQQVLGTELDELARVWCRGAATQVLRPIPAPHAGRDVAPQTRGLRGRLPRHGHPT